MKRKIDFVETAERAARATIKDWIRRALRESFLQALGQAWSISHNQAYMNPRDSSLSSQTKKYEDERVGTEIQVELSLSGVNACFSFVDRVSRAWQTKMKDGQHERAARWVAEVHQQGKSSLWAEQLVDENDGSSDDNEHSNVALDNEKREKKSSSHQDFQSLSVCSTKKDDTRQDSDKSIEERIGTPVKATNDSDEEKESSKYVKDYPGRDHHHHPNVYCKLRALGRRRKIDSPVISIPDALNEIKEFTRDHPTYWPLDNDVIDQACLDMSRRMRARDKHGSGGTANAADGGKSYTKKTVRFKVLPKAVWETKQQQERNQKTDAESSSKVLLDGEDCTESNKIQAVTPFAQGNDHESNVETVLLASMKRNKIGGRSHIALQASQKKSRISERQEIPRVPFDVPQSDDERIRIDLSLEDKKTLDGLLILDNEERDVGRSQPATAAMREVSLGLFGGLQHVGLTNHVILNPDTSRDRMFMARDADKITRRKEKVSIQERLDPNRLQIGRADNPAKRKSKILRTEDWFDDQKKFFDFDLGWCLLEITTEGNQKRLCAFSSMEVCLEDSDC